MEVKLLIQKTLVPGVPSAKAYQLVFTDENIYVLFLSRDWGGFRHGGPNVISTLAQSVAGAISHNVIAEKMQEIQNQNLDELVAKDKNSRKWKYENINLIKHKKKSFLSGPAYVTIKTNTKDSFKFVFDDDESYAAIIQLIQEKRPELLK
jgi:hypothetical protein